MAEWYHASIDNHLNLELCNGVYEAGVASVQLNQLILYPLHYEKACCTKGVDAYSVCTAILCMPDRQTQR